MNIKEIKTRQETLCRIMREKKLEYVVISSTPHIDHKGLLRYFTGQYLLFFEETFLLKADGSTVYFAHDPSAKDTVVKLGTVDEVVLIPGDEYNRRSGKIVAEYLLQDRNGRPLHGIGLGPQEAMSVAFYLSFTEILCDIKIEDLSCDITQCMMIKSELEIEYIRNAVRENEECLRKFKENIAIGHTEVEAIRCSNHYAEQKGAERVNWLVSSDEKNLALYTVPEARRRNHAWTEKDYISVVLEHSFAGGYHGESSQVFCFTDPPEELLEAYKVLDRVFEVIEAVLIPGISVKTLMSQVSEYLSNVMGSHAYLENSLASIGHGQGLATWEFPRIAWDSDMILEENMHVVFHPAIPSSCGIAASYCKHYIVRKNKPEVISALHGIVTVVGK